MTDPRTLPPPFDRIVAVLDLAAGAAGGHVAYATSIRARKTGDVIEVDAAVYIPARSGEDLFLVSFVPGDTPGGVDIVDAAASNLRATDARGVGVVSASGFDRPARKRAGESGVSLIVAGPESSEGWPSWLANTGFEAENLQWRVRNVSLPPVPGLPKNLFESKFGPRDELFANPQGRHFTADELVRRWMKLPGNQQAIREQLPRDGRPQRRDITLRFDRPMTVLASTVRKVPPVLWSDFTVEAWLDVRRVPLKLVESPVEALAGDPRCAYASDPVPEGQEGVGTRLWLWQDGTGDDGEPRIRMEMRGGTAEAVAAEPPSETA
jgi:hypothetical protein